jgi:hypothetical protein
MIMKNNVEGLKALKSLKGMTGQRLERQAAQSLMEDLGGITRIFDAIMNQKSELN